MPGIREHSRDKSGYPGRSPEGNSEPIQGRQSWIDPAWRRIIPLARRRYRWCTDPRLSDNCSIAKCPLRDSNPHRIGFRDRRSAVELRGPQTSMSARSQAAVGRTTLTDDSISQTTRGWLLPTLAMASRSPRLAMDIARAGTRIPHARRPTPARRGRTAAPLSDRMLRAVLAPGAVPVRCSQSFVLSRRGSAGGGCGCAAVFGASVARTRPDIATAAKGD
jgi:hypothetical protein